MIVSSQSRIVDTLAASEMKFDAFTRQVTPT